MMLQIKLDEYWFTLISDILHAAKKKSPLNEFSRQIELQPLSRNFNRFDVLKSLDFLLMSGVVKKTSDDLLCLCKPPSIDWLESYLEEGNEFAWELVREFFSEADVFKKYDDTNNKRIGLSGEKFVLSELYRLITPTKHEFIHHVSEYNDGAGYDIASPTVSSEHSKVYMEIKTTSIALGEFIFYISRNEYEIGQAHNNWFLVFVRIKNGVPIIEGHLPGSFLTGKMPLDSSSGQSSWQTSQMKLNTSCFSSGLPIF